MLKVELTDKDAELFRLFRKFQDDWDRLFMKDFTGSLTLHRDKSDIIFEWREKHKYTV